MLIIWVKIYTCLNINSLT